MIVRRIILNFIIVIIRNAVFVMLIIAFVMKLRSIFILSHSRLLKGFFIIILFFIRNRRFCIKDRIFFLFFRLLNDYFSSNINRTSTFLMLILSNTILVEPLICSNQLLSVRVFLRSIFISDYFIPNYSWFY
jgi:hypothetical protein